MNQIILDLTKSYNKVEITNDTEIIGLFVGKTDDCVQGKLDVVHKLPNLRSLTTIKAVVFDKARFDLSGNLIIAKGANQTDAYLRIDVLMMSKDAFARAVPSLEVMEDSVKGGHGATIGQVDQEQLFYLKTRGLDQHQAENILVEGFVNDLITTVTDPQVKSRFIKMLN